MFAAAAAADDDDDDDDLEHQSKKTLLRFSGWSFSSGPVRSDQPTPSQIEPASIPTPHLQFTSFYHMFCKHVESTKTWVDRLIV